MKIRFDRYFSIKSHSHGEPDFKILGIGISFVRLEVTPPTTGYRMLWYIGKSCRSVGIIFDRRKNTEPKIHNFCGFKLAKHGDVATLYFCKRAVLFKMGKLYAFGRFRKCD